MSLCAMGLFTSASASAGVLFVRANAAPGGSGLSWNSAHADLVSAIAAASASSGAYNEIWIAGGTYKPDRGTGDRTAAFTMFSGLVIRGGFLGNESAPQDRPPNAPPTILSGEIGSALTTADNSFHVLSMRSLFGAFTLDRMTVRGGRADGSSSPNNSGGGLYSEGAPTIIDCIFEDNYASSGAGIYSRYGSGVIRNSIFRGNLALSEGGGVYIRDGGEIERCDFSGNNASFGGGLWTCCGEIRVADCAFTGNFGNYGGGVFNSNGGLTLKRSAFLSNSASRGGAAHLGAGAWIANCFFGGNSGDRGGALYLAGATNAVNCVFSRNFAQSSGGAAWAAGPFTAASCTAYANNALLFGGGLYCETGATSIANSILWANTDSTGATQASQVTRAGLATLAVSRSCSQGVAFTGVGNISTTPRFAFPLGEDGIPGTLDDDLRLDLDSPCIDAGDSYLLLSDATDLDEDGNTSEPTPVDLDLQPRASEDSTRVPPAVDMGAYEYLPPARTPGDATGDGVVNFGDIVEVLTFWGVEEVPADANANGVVDFGDVTAVLTYWAP